MVAGVAGGMLCGSIKIQNSESLYIALFLTEFGWLFCKLKLEFLCVDRVSSVAEAQAHKVREKRHSFLCHTTLCCKTTDFIPHLLSV